MVATPVNTQKSGRHYLIEADSPNQSLLPLTAQVNAQDHLEVGGCDVVELTQRFGTSLYIVDEVTLRTACQQYRDAFKQHYPGESLVIYASKAWNCLAIDAIVNSEGLGIDVVSAGELYTATKAGFKGDKIYVHGNNKSSEELQMSIDQGATIVVDSWSELRSLAQMTQQQTARIMVRLTPGIECHTHEYIKTGCIDSKFGFDPSQVEQVFEFVAQNKGLNFVGLHAHIGSQIFELKPHEDLGAVMVDWLTKAQQHGLSIEQLDIGGGLGIRYTESDDPPSIDAWAKTVCESVAAACKSKDVPLPKLIAEPGRSLVGTSCVTAYTVGGHKTIPDVRTYLSVDGGMSDNPRPITYQSLYFAVVANHMSQPMTETVTIAGKHCESGDVLIKDASLPPTQAGDILVIPDTGAYNYSMSSNYNRIARPAAVLVRDGNASLILERETLDDLLRHDRLPDHLLAAQ
ncbi:diaminopimelate decarboxylase [filamentous cyanobacterium LEGE 11480]|uniref:Diaminopimelate decarboxylase n=1 Tax=Romeriopsis navalis LEGE 11480 TaxID=2777977 RepID=A0A928Z547_9CYAN|nr:diaminopimelate decarboxylase [Romeriopsis navalis]MBE9030875.1 diaminopimelate decarboxylase [Romeriopsis navalis LEGE 11480]